MKWRLSLFLSILFFYGNSAHIIGGEITYRCIEEGKYEITMILYRDCNGNGALFDSTSGSPFPATVTIYEEGEELPRIFELDAPIIEDISELNQIPFLKPPLNSCVEKGTYTFEVEL